MLINNHYFLKLFPSLHYIKIWNPIIELSGLKMKFRETPKQLPKCNSNESNTIIMVWSIYWWFDFKIYMSSFLVIGILCNKISVWKVQHKTLPLSYLLHQNPCHSQYDICFCCFNNILFSLFEFLVSFSCYYAIFVQFY